MAKLHDHNNDNAEKWSAAATLSIYAQINDTSIKIERFY